MQLQVHKLFCVSTFVVIKEYAGTIDSFLLSLNCYTLVLIQFLSRILYMKKCWMFRLNFKLWLVQMLQKSLNLSAEVIKLT